MTRKKIYIRCPCLIPTLQVANDGSDPIRAVHSLPRSLAVRPSQIQMAGDGVWAKEQVPRGVRFGPYQGVKVEDDDDARKSGYSWMVVNCTSQLHLFIIRAV